MVRMKKNLGKTSKAGKRKRRQSEDLDAGAPKEKEKRELNEKSWEKEWEKGSQSYLY